MASYFFLVIYFRLKILNVSKNCLAGLPPPSESGELNKLRELYLSMNCLGDNCMETITAYTRLRLLHLAYNEIHFLYEKYIIYIKLNPKRVSYISVKFLFSKRNNCEISVTSNSLLALIFIVQCLASTICFDGSILLNSAYVFIKQKVPIYFTNIRMYYINSIDIYYTNRIDVYTVSMHIL